MAEGEYFKASGAPLAINYELGVVIIIPNASSLFHGKHCANLFNEGFGIPSLASGSDALMAKQKSKICSSKTIIGVEL